MRNFLLLPVILFLIGQQSFATIYYVDAAKPNNNGSGTSWATAKKDLQDALNMAVAGDSVLVAEGTYYPTKVFNITSTDPRDKSFFLNKDITLLGGYPSGGGTSSWGTKPTILSGNIGSLRSDSDNSYHVFITTGLTRAALIQGFVIMHGRASNPGTVNFVGETFGRFNGGGMYNIRSSPTLKAIFFVHNTATSSGGGLYNDKSNISLSNSAACYNSADIAGGGISNARSTTSFTNITLAFNSAINGAGIYVYADTLAIYNSVIYGNTTNGTCNLDICMLNAVISAGSAQNASDISGGTLSSLPGFQHLNSNPFASSPAGPDSMFMTRDDGLRPKFGSKLINNAAGAVSLADTIDITGIPRMIGGSVDIGAYEYNCTSHGGIVHRSCDTSFTTPSGKTIASSGIYLDTLINSQNCDSLIRLDLKLDPQVIYVDASRPDNSGDGYSWATAKKDLQNGLDLALSETGCDSVKVAEGIYYPTESPDGDTTNPRKFTFHINKDMLVLGGYPRGGGKRDFITNRSILSGDIGILNDRLDNCNHIFITVNLFSSTIDGFSIIDGNGYGANSSDIYYAHQYFSSNYAAGIYIQNSTLLLRNLVLTNHFGRGVYSSESYIYIQNSVFANNEVLGWGCGVSTLTSSLQIQNALFLNNKSSSQGGGLSISYSPVKLTNVAFVNNSATTNGSAIDIQSNSSLSLYNNVFYGNGTNSISNPFGGIITADSRNNASDITTGPLAGTTNFISLTSDPFYNSSYPKGSDSLWMTPDDGIKPAKGSILIDAGAISTIDSSISTDLSGLARVDNDSVDIGCYEYQCILTFGNTISVHNGILTANTLNVPYQWVDCNNSFAAIPGATSQTYTPVVNGAYAVVVSDSSCTDTSSCITVNDVSIPESQLKESIHIYPNPTTGNVNLVFPISTSGRVEVEIFNSQGQSVSSYHLNKADAMELTLPHQKGIYFLKIQLEGKTVVQKVVKE